MKLKEVQTLASEIPADGTVALPAALVLKLVGVVEDASTLIHALGAGTTANPVPLALKIGALEP